MEEIAEIPRSGWSENLRKAGLALSVIGLGTLAVNDAFLVVPDMLGLADLDAIYNPIAISATIATIAGVTLNCIGVGRVNNH